MYVTRVPNRGAPPAILLRESYRAGTKVRTRTLANLSRWPEAKIEARRRVLKGETLVAPPERLAIERSLPHGHVALVLGVARKLGRDRLVPRRPERLAKLALALIVARVLEPAAKLAPARQLSAARAAHSLGAVLGLGAVDEDELDRALDLLGGAQAKIGAVLGRRKVAKHFGLTITDDGLSFVRQEAAIAKEVALDGFSVLRTSVPAAALDAPATVLASKSLAQVERAFRALQTVDLEVRPIHHRLAGRVRAHVFLCLLAYYVQWHLRRALAPLLSDDHDRAAAAAARPSPLAAARVSPAARAKAQTKHTAAGQPAHSFRTLLQDLATLTRNTVRLGDAPPITLLARPTPLQQQVFHRLGLAL